MYGLVVEGVYFMVSERFGAELLTQVLVKGQLANQTTSTHDRYSERIVPNLFLAICECTSLSMEEVGVLAG
jgi:hypothetical protein